MITGYDVGTEVKWNEENTLTIGTVRQVFRQSGETEVHGQRIYVKVSEESPSYLIQKTDGTYVILPHQDVMLKETNLHT